MKTVQEKTREFETTYAAYTNESKRAIAIAALAFSIESSSQMLSDAIVKAAKILSPYLSTQQRDLP